MSSAGSGATARPWVKVGGAIAARFKDSRGRRCTAFLAQCVSATEDNEANEQLILTAVNSHDLALRLAREVLAGFGDVTGDGPVLISASIARDFDKLARELLAKVEG